jgi:hypothetical protein
MNWIKIIAGSQFTIVNRYKKEKRSRFTAVNEISIKETILFTMMNRKKQRKRD